MKYSFINNRRNVKACNFIGSKICEMKTPVSIQDQKIRFLETFMRVNDSDLISKLHELLLRESNKNGKASLITDEMLDELDERWTAYKNNGEKSFTFEQVRSSARQKLKSRKTK